MIRTPRFAPSRLITTTALVTAVVVLTGCNVDKVSDAPKERSLDTYWTMSNDIKAATIAVGGTQKIVATPLSGAQAPITNLPKPTYYSRNVAFATVDSNGVVTGVAPTSGVQIISSLTIDGVTHADTSTVAVTTQRRSIKTFKISDFFGDPLDSTMNVGGFLYASYTATDSSDVPITNLSVDFRSLDPKIIGVQGGSLDAQTLGKTKIIASATAYGRTVADTIEMAVSYSNNATIYISAGNFYQNAVVVAVGGTVTWINNGYTQEEANIIFDSESPNIVGGSVPSLPYGENATRSFTAEGTYTYKNTKSGQTGKVIVRSQPQY